MIIIDLPGSNPASDGESFHYWLGSVVLSGPEVVLSLPVDRIQTHLAVPA